MQVVKYPKFLSTFLIIVLLMLSHGISSSPLTNFAKPVPVSNKHVIGSTTAGFFSNFFMVINHIDWCLRKKKIPVVYWDRFSPYFQPQGYNGAQNAWEYYFEPLSKRTYKHGDPIRRLYFAPDGSGIRYQSYTCIEMINVKLWANNIINKHIKIRTEISTKIDEFYNQHLFGKVTVGIHLRGTDKHNEVRPVSLMAIIEEAKKYPCDQYFIATDDQSLLNQAIYLLKKPVIYYNSARSTTGAAVHVVNDGNKAILGEQVLIEAILLSKCNKFIHTCSNVSTAVHFFNPAIDYVLMHG